MEPRLDEIRNRYKKYRHKLFGHNDKKREDWVGRYNAAGITWASLEKDFEYLDYVFKCLWQVHKGEVVTDQTRARDLHFPHDQSRRAVIKDTEEFLRGLVSRSAPAGI
jgi:hypothetical protein